MLPYLPYSHDSPLQLSNSERTISLFSVIQYTVVSRLLGCVQLFATPWTAVSPASLSSTISQSLFKFMYFVSMMLSNHLILCCPLPLLSSMFPRIWVFSDESAPRIRWPKYWSFSFSITTSNEYPGLISFRIDWFDHLAVQGTDSQESSPAPQLKSINSLALSLLYGPTLTSICDYRENHSFD